MRNTISRRVMIIRGLAGSLTARVAGGVAAVLVEPALRLTATAAPAPLTPLDPKDPAAAALGYVTDTASVDNKANPNHAADQKCVTCVQFRGTPTDAVAGCAIFAGKSVTATGWCKLWASVETSTPE
jgi:hypothetical protein